MTGSDCPENALGLPSRQQRRQLLEQALRHAAIGMALAGGDGRVLEVNDALCRLLGREARSLLQLPLTELIHPDDRAGSIRLLDALRGGGREAFQREIRCLHADGQPIWGQMSVSGLREGSACLLLVQIADIGGIKRQLQQALQSDPLTGLPNRHGVLRQLSPRAGGALLSVGIDRLTEVNHGLTHRAGDQLIQTVSSRLVGALGGMGGIARGTGDSFLVHAPELRTPEEAGTLAERLRQACKGSMLFEGNPIPITVSVGVSLWRAGVDAEELLRDAVIAMRQAAADGRDRCGFADAEVTSQARQNLELQDQLRRAIHNGELQAWCMPLVEMATGALRGYESLVRWQRPDGQIALPDAFLPAARRGQLAAEIDLLMLAKAMEALSSLPPPLSVAVNLTPTSLGEPRVVEQVREGLERHGLAPERLHLEITETALLNRTPRIEAAMQQLAQLGVRWVLDDFGTGYSSISNLRDLPIHGLKLDRSFTEAIRRGDQKSLRLAQALAGLAEGLGLTTVAEGIERPEEAAALQALGWQQGQGHYYGEPAPLSHWPRGEAAGAPPQPLISRLSRSTWALAVTDNVPVGLFALRALSESAVEPLFVSRRCLSLLQLSREQIEADSAVLLSRLQADDRPGFVEQWRRSSASGQPFRWEGRLALDDGVLWLLVEAAAISQVDGSLIWQGVLSDVTAGKQQELQLRQIINEAPIPIAILELQGNPARFRFANRQFEQLFGYGTADVPTLDSWFERAYPNPELRQEMRDTWQASLARAQAGGGVIQGREVSVTTAAGEVRDAVFSAVVVGEEVVISAVDLTPWHRAEQALSEARLALAETALAITEAIPVGTYTMVQPPDGGIGSFSFMSDRFLEICGLDRDEAAADPFKAFACVHPDDYERWVALNADTFARQVPFRGECRVVVDGQVKWIVAESVPRSLSDGSTVWEGVLSDITELRLASQELAASEEHFRLLAENMSDVVFRLAQDGRIVWVSPSLTPTLGWTPEDWIGQVGSTFLVDGGNAQVQALLQTIKGGVEPTLIRDQIYAKDGSTHWMETHVSPYRDAQGRLNGLVASFRLIDAMQAAEAELRLSEERYRLLAENARDVIWTMEPDGRISYVSPSIQLLRGFTPEEAMRQPLHEIHPPESLARSQSYFQQLLSDLAAQRPPEAFRGELEYFCRGGGTIWAEVIALPRLDAEGRLVKLLGVSRDITERKRFEQQITEANSQLEALAITDSLTGIGNRRHLEALIHGAIELADRHGLPLALILCDIDWFKAINDNHGHQVGDRVLVEFSQRLQQHLRRTDGFGRWGGEEFMILLPSSNLASARLLAEQLRQLVAGSPFAVVGQVTASFGVAERQPGEAESAWFRRVDACLYSAKQGGRNRVSA